MTEAWSWPGYPSRAKGRGDGGPGRWKGTSLGPRVLAHLRLRTKGSCVSAELVELDADGLTQTQTFLQKNILAGERRSGLGPGLRPYWAEWPHLRRGGGA